MHNENQTDLGLLDRIKIVQKVNREWRPHLSVTERDFLFYLLDNTVLWGRYDLKVTINQLVNGTQWGLPPVGLSRATVCRLLRSFKRRGLLNSTTDGRKITLTFNAAWAPSLLHCNNMVEIPMKQKKRKSGDASSRFSSEFSGEIDIASEVSERDTRSISVRLQKSQRETPKYISREREAKQSYDAERRGLVTDVLERGEGTSKATIKNPRSSRKRQSESNWSIWRDAWEATFPDAPCPGWKGYETKHVESLRQRSTFSMVNWPDFLNWSVCHWSSIRATHFSWMTQSPPPVFPAVSFFLRFSDRFLDAYTNREVTLKQSADFSSNATIQKLVQSGLSHEEALIEYGKQQALADQREKLQQQRKEIDLLNRTAERMRQQQASPQSRTHKRTAEVRVSHGDNPFDKDDPVQLDDLNSLNWED